MNRKGATIDGVRKYRVEVCKECRHPFDECYCDTKIRQSTWITAYDAREVEPLVEAARSYLQSHWDRHDRSLFEALQPFQAEEGT